MGNLKATLSALTCAFYPSLIGLMPILLRQDPGDVPANPWNSSDLRGYDVHRSQPAHENARMES